MKCTFEPCVGERSPKAGFGLCTLHYGQRRRGLPLSLASYKLTYAAGQVCSQANCDRKVSAKGLCRAHYGQARLMVQLRPIRARVARHRGAKCDVTTCDQARHSLRWCRPHYHWWREFGVDPQVYDDILVSQGGVCAICRTNCATGRRLALDHDHGTGKVRGLLCSNCNRAIGLLREDPAIVEAALKYLSVTDRAFDASIRKVA